MNYPPYPIKGIFYRIEQARANQNWNQEGERVQHINICKYRAFQEERSIFREIKSIGNSKQKICICTCALFRMFFEIELFYSTVAKLLIKKIYYALFLISVFTVQVTKLVQIIYYNTFSKIPPSTSLLIATRVRTWDVARLRTSWRSFMLAKTSICAHFFL
jgi:hypothetical protein